MYYHTVHHLSVTLACSGMVIFCVLLTSHVSALTHEDMKRFLSRDRNWNFCLAVLVVERSRSLMVTIVFPAFMSSRRCCLQPFFMISCVEAARCDCSLPLTVWRMKKSVNCLVGDADILFLCCGGLAVVSLQRVWEFVSELWPPDSQTQCWQAC